MKGTAPRGLTSAEDRRRRASLAASVKDRAENAMIVDMTRNDLGRVARPGSVCVASAFDVEKYPTLLQMTSTVTARTSASLVEILQATFPPASITGAPKIRTMEIIRELEPDPRGVYTGCIGWLSPGRKARFNVAIRTVAIDRAAAEAEYGVGGGIVWDSDPAAEYAECETKAAVLAAELPQFELLETMLLDSTKSHEDDRGYFLLERHLRRLAESADYFDFALDPAEVRRRLDELAAGLTHGTHRVRLRVDRQGRVAVESTPLPAEASSAAWRLRPAERPIDRRNAFLYHKTTCRSVYPTVGPDLRRLRRLRPLERPRTSDRNDHRQSRGRKGRPARHSAGPMRSVAGHVSRPLLETGEHLRGGRDDGRPASGEELVAINSVRKWLPAVLV